MKTVHAYNRLTGVVAVVPEDHVNHPVLGKNLEVRRNGKPVSRLGEIAKDPAGSATRVTNVAPADKDKD